MHSDTHGRTYADGYGSGTMLNIGNGQGSGTNVVVGDGHVSGADIAGLHLCASLFACAYVCMHVCEDVLVRECNVT
jgi:hypothetical protein